MKEPDYDKEMKLPSGKTCNDCVHSRRCFAFGFSETKRISCDFWPNKFVEKISQLQTTPRWNED